MRSRTQTVATIDEAREAAQAGFAAIGWDALGREAGETTLAESGITVRCIQRPDGKLPLSLDDDDLIAIVGRAY